ncbi:hypothetical protein HOO65_050780 [Ceratocystis lukuohia]|uniref:Retrotransposable element Tf2 155 kDa protein type 1 n=1 Tax=Ceratocystis lukuohia TaxID=2019550 RepID=A0ABR4MHG4_9PEZI
MPAKPQFVRRLRTFERLIEKDSKDHSMYEAKVFRATVEDINKALDRLYQDQLPTDPSKWKSKVPAWVSNENVDAFNPDAQFTKRLPPHRPGMDHEIELSVPDDKAPWGPLYKMSRDELLVLRQTILTLLQKDYIRPSKSTAAAPILFVKKPGGGLRFCVDYRALNGVMIKDRYPLPNITETLRNVSEATLFTKLDVISAFHNIRIAKGDEWKTAFRTRQGLYEWQVMPFGLANAPAHFQRFINSLLRPYLDVWASAYVDDVLIFTNGTPEDHYEKVNTALTCLREGGLTVDINKCEFATQEITYLGYILRPGRILTDPKKISAISEWETPSSVQHVRKFLGLCNFYRGFIDNYSEVVMPLNALVTTKKTFCWNEAADEAFRKLKQAFTSAPILCSHDPELTTIVEADASGYAMGAALLQIQPDGSKRPCAYTSRKLTASECNYAIHDKELLAIIYALKEWRSELKGLKDAFEVVSDHKNLLHFTKLQHLSERQARWYLTLSEYNCFITHRPGKLSALPDALSRRDMPEGPDDGRFEERKQQLLQSQRNGVDEVLKVRRTDSQLLIPSETTPPDSLPEKMKSMWSKAVDNDKDLEQIRACLMAKDSQWPEDLRHRLRVGVSDCSLDDKMRVLYRGRFWVPNSEPLRTALMQDVHDSPTLIHPGKNVLYAELARMFFWPNFVADVRRFSRNCQVCGSTNTWRTSKEGLLKPLPIPDQPWQDIAIDFIGPLPTAKKGEEEFTHILTVIDCMSKGVLLMPMKALDMENVADAFFHNYYRHHGLPRSILSDREFVNAAWKMICTELGVERRSTTAYHPATNGAVERMNAEVKSKLAKLGAQGPHWLKAIPMVEFALNATPSSATQISPFFLSHGYHPKTIDLEPPQTPPPNPDGPLGQAKRVLDKLRSARDWAKANLTMARATMEEAANEKRRPHRDYQPGDWVWLTLRKEHFGPGLGRGLQSKHIRCKVKEKVGSHTYKLDVPGSTAHDTYHADRLRPAADDAFPSQTTHDDRPGPVGHEDGVDKYDAEKILNQRTRYGKLQYRVKWQGWNQPTWEPAEYLENTIALEEWKETNAQQPETRRRRRRQM